MYAERTLIFDRSLR